MLRGLMQRLWCLFLLVAALATPPTLGSAQSVTQVKPWFLLIVDTSSSMGACTTSPCGVNDPRNTCGFQRNRIGDAKCALQRIIASTGDAELGLMQFSHSCDATCADTGTGGSCDAQLLAAIAESNQPGLYQWVDGQCQSNCTGNNYTREIRMGNGTPIAQSLVRAYEYFAGTLPAAQVVANNGNTYPSPLVGDSFGACRPVAVIVLTDGAESCGGDPITEANRLLNAGPMARRIPTYAIGFGDPTNANEWAGIQMQVNGLAAAGGTTQGYFATNEATVSVALNQIIADSQLPPETCNDADDNCNGLIDEGIQKFCDPTNIAAGPTLCTEPNELLCDGVDDDCDGIIDEGLSNACGVCGQLPSETCDNLDNDCDGRFDEEVLTGEPCGTTAGSCQVGMTDCVNGQLICVGQLVPGVEVCDCQDNDCDTFIDESFEGQQLCAIGAACVACSCQTLCVVNEFSDVFCPTDLMPEILDSGLCVCITSTCDADACAMETQERDGAVACTADSEDITHCVCKAGACVNACADVTCPTGQVCDPRDTRGVCKPDNCSSLGCRSEELCNAATGLCEPDLCIGTSCADNEACRDGICEPTCANVTCEAGQRCKRGVCTIDRCLPNPCGQLETCDPANGECVRSQSCNPICVGDATCNGLRGECDENPCRRIHCPDATFCADGECVTRSPMDDAGVPRQNVLATGGGGCACTVVGSARQATPWNFEVVGGVLCLLSLLFWRARRRRRLAGAAIIALMTTLTIGCEVEPFCITSCDDEARDGSVADAQHDTGDDNDGGGTGGVGGGDTDGSVAGDGGDGGSSNCRRGTTETCNGRDDDCDFKVDEDTFEPINFCDTRGVCADDTMRCGGGAGWVCRHGADHEGVETLCDQQDNDCDGAIDEGAVNLGDECGTGIGACRVTGEFICNDNGIGTQCSLTQPGTPGAEVCDGIDNDCDGRTDEPKSAPGDNPSFVQQALVQIGSLWIYPYEASRADATALAQGNASARACSTAGVLPWTNVTYAEARAACQAADMDLCTETQWRAACEDGPGGTTCAWGFTNSGNACGDLATAPTECNGEEYDSDPATTTLDDDALLPTGSRGRCFSSAAGGSVFDLSGNAKEFTRARSSGVNPLRGGSYNNVVAGLRCDFDFTVVNDAFKFQNVGFRCCSTSDPN